MCVSLQQWRVAVRSFAGMIASSSWSPKSGATKVRVRMRKSVSKDHDRGGFLARFSVVNIILMVLVVETLMTVNILSHSNSSPLPSPTSQHGRVEHAVGEVVDNWTAGQVRSLLLLISMDVECNPAPVFQRIFPWKTEGRRVS